eukprot:264178_1
MGYDIFVFVSRTAAEKFLCAVCQGVAKDVFETDCGHIFCRQCVGKLIRVTTTDQCSAQCPHCRECITWQNVHGSKFLNREISQLQCKCNLCHEWIGNLSKLSPHQLQDCPDQFMDCTWKKYGCKETKIKRKDIAQHNQDFKVQHLELKLHFVTKQHETQIQRLKKKYEQQIVQLNQDKISIEKKWKLKLISLHKKFGTQQANVNNNAININHIEHMNISNTTHSNSLHNIQVQKDTLCQYHSDGSISFDPNHVATPVMSAHTSHNTSGVSTGRKKRKRSAVEDTGSTSDYGLTVNENNSNNNSHSKRSKKRRRMDQNASNIGKSGGSTLNSLMGIGGTALKSKNSKVRSTSNRKKKAIKSQTPKRRVQPRRGQSNSDSDPGHQRMNRNNNNNNIETSDSGSESDRNMS